MSYYRKRKPSFFKKIFIFIVYILLIFGVIHIFFPEIFNKYSQFINFDYEKYNKTNSLPEEKTPTSTVVKQPEVVVEPVKVIPEAPKYTEYLNVIYATIETPIPSNTTTPDNSANTVVTSDTPATPVVAQLPVVQMQKRELKLNIYRPINSSENNPTAIFISGENFSLSKESAQSSLLYKKVKELTAKGVTVVDLEYRDVSEAKFPTQIYDIKAAIRFLKVNASTYGIDENKIFAIGENTGGTLAELLGVTNNNPKFEGTVGISPNVKSSSINYVIAFGAVSDIISLFTDSENSSSISREYAYSTFDSIESPYAKLIDFNSEKWMGISAIRKMVKKEATLTNSYYWNRVVTTKMASPLYSVSDKTVPMFLVHNNSDKKIPVQQSIQMAKKLDEQKVENIFVTSYSPTGTYDDEAVIKLSLDWVLQKMSAK